MKPPAGARFVVCRVHAASSGMAPGRKLAFVHGDRVHLRMGSGLTPTWHPKSRAVADVTILRDATPRELSTGMIGPEAIEASPQSFFQPMNTAMGGLHADRTRPASGSPAKHRRAREP